LAEAFQHRARASVADAQPARAGHARRENTAQKATTMRECVDG
jgi:hypothetical protein